MLVIWARRHELLHPIRKTLGRFGSPEGARWWSWAVLVLPFCAGFGLTLPAIAMLRVPVAGGAGAGACALRRADRLRAGPRRCRSRCSNAWRFPCMKPPRALLRRPPDARERAMDTRPAGAARAHRRGAAREPDRPLRHSPGSPAGGGDLATAEKSYRRTLGTLAARRALNNLGNVLAMQGRANDALEAYEKSATADPTNAAALFNASQIRTQRFEYQQASDALNRASALNFELVKSSRAQATTDGLLPLADLWLSPSLFWKALGKATSPRDLHGSLPTGLRESVGDLRLAVEHPRAPARRARRVGRDPPEQQARCARAATAARRCAAAAPSAGASTRSAPACAHAEVEGQAETHEFSRACSSCTTG